MHQRGRLQRVVGILSLHRPRRKSVQFTVDERHQPLGRACLARGDGMRERDLKRAQDQQAQMDAYVRQTAGSSGGVADELAKLNDLQSSGVITAEQFEAQKAKLLS